MKAIYSAREASKSAGEIDEEEGEEKKKETDEKEKERQRERSVCLSVEERTSIILNEGTVLSTRSFKLRRKDR